MWLPREADNSAGGQVWVPDGAWGPLAGHMLHLSYGRCRMLLTLLQKTADGWQGGAVDSGLVFLSGVKSGRFRPKDGHLYVVGLNGWQTAARKDGCLQRVRSTGKPVTLPVGLTAAKGSLTVTFAEPLDAKSAGDVGNYRVERWNYRWSADYGSKQWSVQDPKREGADGVALAGIAVRDGGKEVVLKVNDLGPAMQMRVAYELKTAAGEPVKGVLWNTVREAK